MAVCQIKIIILFLSICQIVTVKQLTDRLLTDSKKSNPPPIAPIKADSDSSLKKGDKAESRATTS